MVAICLCVFSREDNVPSSDCGSEQPEKHVDHMLQMWPDVVGIFWHTASDLLVRVLCQARYMFFLQFSKNTNTHKG